MLISLLTVLQLVLGAWMAFLPGNNTGIAIAVSTILYAIFYFFAIKQHFGKIFFTILIISNITHLTISFEWLLSPLLALQSYRCSFSLMLFGVKMILSVPIYHIKMCIHLRWKKAFRQGVATSLADSHNLLVDMVLYILQEYISQQP